jgi:hypothetical protein
MNANLGSRSNSRQNVLKLAGVTGETQNMDKKQEVRTQEI